jgi:hypothetical protein
LALILVAFAIWLIDGQSGVPGPLTLLATAVFAVGTLWLWNGVSMSWVPMTVGIVGLFVVMWLGMPLTIRGRFGTPRIDREGFVGEEALIVADGRIELRGAEWLASGTQQAGLGIGDAVAVTGVEELVFTVEPIGVHDPVA